MARGWHLKSRPVGMPTRENFELREIAGSTLEEGMVRVRNRWLSVDPYMRGRMNNSKSYAPPFRLNEPLEGGAVGEIVESKADGLEAGDLVLHFGGWRDEALVPAQTIRKLPGGPAKPQDF